MSVKTLSSFEKWLDSVVLVTIKRYGTNAMRKEYHTVQREWSHQLAQILQSLAPHLHSHSFRLVNRHDELASRSYRSCGTLEQHLTDRSILQGLFHLLGDPCHAKRSSGLPSTKMTRKAFHLSQRKVQPFNEHTERH